MKPCLATVLATAAALAGCGGGADDAPPRRLVQAADSVSALATPDRVAPVYVLDFVGTAASGSGLNDAGDVVGKSYPDPGCGPFCLPPQEPVVWRAGSRVVLPAVPGFDANSQYPRFIDNQGLIAGVAGIPGSTTHAAAWVPAAGAYVAQDLGVYPGTSSAEVAGLDAQGRIIGWSTLGGAIPTLTVPFLWTQAGGMVDLKALGYPNERPAAISPGGRVVTWGSSYQLGNPASAVPLPAPPPGYVGAGVNGSAINDAGDQAHFLVSTSTQNLVYAFRLSNGGSWQMLSSFGTGHLSSYGMGGINADQDVTFTAGSAGLIAAGPAGLGQSIAALISPAYGGASVAGVASAGPMNASGQILAQVFVGRSARLVKLTPASACGANCLVSSALAMTAQFVQDPAFPGSCFQGGRMYNLSSATVTVTSEAGAPLANVQVSGRFLDDYWTNRVVTGTTDATGAVSWTYKGPCGVGAIAFLVDNAVLGTRSFDRTRGRLADFLIPTATANKPPVAVPAVRCVAGRTCTFDGSGSYDPDGSVAAYRWSAANGTTLSTQAVFTKTFPAPGLSTATLTVTDDGGLSASKKITFRVPR